MTTISTNAMAKRHLEALGYTVDVAEHWIQRKGSSYGFRRDLFHCIDVVGLKDDQWLNVQACSEEAIHGAKSKVKKTKEIKRILEGPTDFEIWEFYDSGDGWYIRRWCCLTAGGKVVDFGLKADEPSLDRLILNQKARARRQKDKQKASGQETLGGIEANNPPF